MNECIAFPHSQEQYKVLAESGHIKLSGSNQVLESHKLSS